MRLLGPGAPSWAWIVTITWSAWRRALLTIMAISAMSSGCGSVRTPGASASSNRLRRKLRLSPDAGGFIFRSRMVARTPSSCSRVTS